MPIPEIVSIAKAKARLSEIARQAHKGKTFEVISHSQPLAILIGIEEYKALLERLEDMEDALAILEGKLASTGKPHIPWDKAKAEYWAEHPEEAERVSG